MKPENYQTNPIFALTGVGKTFRSGTEALQGIDLTVTSGTFVSLLGPSGCGKSTLLRIIAGLVPPSRGRVDWARDVGGHIGFVFQEPTLMPWATVWDNVYLPLRLAGRARSDASASIAATLASLGLGGFERAYPRELSGGMRMRVSIARALVKSPRLLLLDEPFAALDELTRFRLNEDLLRLWEEQCWTVVFVTHSVFEAVFLSNRIVVMTPRPGRVVADLPVELPYPREAGLRTAPAYAERCRAVSAVLNEAVA
ncbi:MAG TPA: ABC transporter ATP-binding protein [Stellaceae bacterium]|nr:ABC transporter ATP-binding protein [Stellaceae bacterium]